MNGISHEVVGVSLSLAVLSAITSGIIPAPEMMQMPETNSILPAANSLLWGTGFLVASDIGSLFPDIDTSSSTICNRFNLCRIPKWIGYHTIPRKERKGLGFYRYQYEGQHDCDTFGHRAYTHSLFIWLIVLALMIYFKAHFIAWGFLIGVFSHLFLDALTKGGIPIIFFRNRKVRKNKRLLPLRFCFRSGSMGSMFFSCILGLVNSLAAVYFFIGNESLVIMLEDLIKLIS